MEMAKFEGITLFKETIEYLTKGDIDEHQFCELIRMAYETKFNGKDYKDDEIQDRDVKLIWKTLKYSYKKSKENADFYKRKKQQEVVDEETGEIIKEDDCSNVVGTFKENKVPETKQETLKPIPFKDLPDNIKKMWNERRLSLGAVFSKTSRLSKESKKEKWESICSEYGVEPNQINLKSVQVLYKEYESSKDYADAQFQYQAASMNLNYNN